MRTDLGDIPMNDFSTQHFQHEDEQQEILNGIWTALHKEKDERWPDTLDVLIRRGMRAHREEDCLAALSKCKEDVVVLITIPIKNFTPDEVVRKRMLGRVLESLMHSFTSSAETAYIVHMSKSMTQ